MLNQKSGDLDRVGGAERSGVEGVTGSVTVTECTWHIAVQVNLIRLASRGI